MKNLLRHPIRYEVRRPALGEPSQILPFPGAYPTRWKIDIEYSFRRQQPGVNERWAHSDDNQRFQYLGKPTTEIANRVHRIILHSYRGFGHIVEFDRAGVFMTGEPFLPRDTIQVSSWDDTKARFYYPHWYGTGSILTSPWAGRIVHRASVLWQGRRATFYTTTPQEQLTPEDLGVHKEWLEHANLQWGKRPLI